MKTLHHHAHLAPHEIADIKQAIQFCRVNSQRRVSVLGFAQERCPNAYQDYIDNANKNLGLTHYFNTTDTKPQHLKFRFVQREQELRECENSK